MTSSCLVANSTVGPWPSDLVIRHLSDLSILKWLKPKATQHHQGHSTSVEKSRGSMAFDPSDGSPRENCQLFILGITAVTWDAGIFLSLKSSYFCISDQWLASTVVMVFHPDNLRLWETSEMYDLVYGVLQPRKIIKSLLWWVGFLRPSRSDASRGHHLATSRNNHLEYIQIWEAYSRHNVQPYMHVYTLIYPICFMYGTLFSFGPLFDGQYAMEHLHVPVFVFTHAHYMTTK